MKHSLEGLSYEQLAAALAESGVNPVHARPLFQAVQQKLLRGDLSQARGVLPPLQRWLASPAALDFCSLEAVGETASSDACTRKYLLRLGGGKQIESVQMGFSGRYTACLSSQVGCAMGCVFCATGQMGFGRNLTAAEIVAQAHHVERELRLATGERLRNVVMMGMGEPLHNFYPVMQALEIITDTRGLNIGPARVVISTVGYVPGIQKLARHPKRYSLAVSLHGSTDEERGKLVPINQRWPLAELLAACREYSAIKRARVFFAWTLIRGANDSDEHAHRLAELLQGMNAHVNLIPLNPTEGFDGKAPDAQRVRAFQRIIQAANLPSTVRQRRGIDVDAGCGQLTSSHARGRVLA